MKEIDRCEHFASLRWSWLLGASPSYTVYASCKRLYIVLCESCRSISLSFTFGAAVIGWEGRTLTPRRSSLKVADYYPTPNCSAGLLASSKFLGCLEVAHIYSSKQVFTDLLCAVQSTCQLVKFMQLIWTRPTSSPRCAIGAQIETCVTYRYRKDSNKFDIEIRPSRTCSYPLLPIWPRDRYCQPQPAQAHGIFCSCRPIRPLSCCQPCDR